MHIIVVGLNHKTAPIELREKVCFPSDAIEEPLRKVISLSHISEGLILSTCNRVEVLAVSKDIEEGTKEIKDFLASYHNISMSQLDSHLYSYASSDAIKHIFHVASSLDSMIVGEPQILGQLKDAYRAATMHKTSGTILHRFLHKAFSVAKKVRTETRIATSAVSVSYAAVELAKKIFNTLGNKIVLLIGAGEMAELAARHLLNNGVRDMLIANRTYSRAEKLAVDFGGTPVAFEHLTLFLDQVDIIISSTDSPHYIIKYSDVRRALKIRKHKPIFCIDIAVPRDIDPKINNIDNVYLYDIDDLEGVVDANREERNEEAKKAEKLIEKEVDQFQGWLGSLDVVPTVVSLREKFEEIRKREVDKAISNLNGSSDIDQKILESLTSSIINKILHGPVTKLKGKKDTLKGSYYVDAVRDLFNLEE
ncbi:MAG: glutamyl-tRNA reductase [Thermodesulfobacteriota bacterium]|nr:glutamyl-tRNA reductase [Thermodesulfobacteriota bacterium]